MLVTNQVKSISEMQMKTLKNITHLRDFGKIRLLICSKLMAGKLSLTTQNNLLNLINLSTFTSHSNLNSRQTS